MTPKVPAGHGSHDTVPLGAVCPYVPCAHLAQTETEVAPTWVASEPCAHSWHSVAPGTGAYVLAGQEVQLDAANAPAELPNVPAGQSVQQVAPLVLE